MNFFEEILEDPIKLWGSIIVVCGILFYIFNGNNNGAITSDPFSQESSFVSEEELAEADEFFEGQESSFVSEDDMQNDIQDDSFAEDNLFETKPLTYKKSVVDTKTGLIVEKEFDMQGHEIITEDESVDKDQKIEELEQRVNQLEQKLNSKKEEKDPFSKF